MEDARRRGLEVRPVDVLASRWECTLEPASGAQPPRNVGFAARMGLRFVKGLGEKDWEAILSVRESAGWSADRSAGRPDGPPDLSELIRRTGIDEGTLAGLAEAGALRGFGVERRTALWRVSGAGRSKERGGSRSAGRRRSREGPAESPAAQGAPPQAELPVGDSELLPDFTALSSFESIGWDYLVTGHSVQGHPLEPFREELGRQGLPDAGTLNAGEDGGRVSYAGLVICRQRPGTAGGVVFMTLEDESGFVNCVVWAKTFETYRTVILANTVLGVSGTLQSQDGVVHVLVESCWKPRLSRPPANKESRDFH